MLDWESAPLILKWPSCSFHDYLRNLRAVCLQNVGKTDRFETMNLHRRVNSLTIESATSQEEVAELKLEQLFGKN